ncbi:acetoacetate decarboxylase family protein [Streptomyces sp. MST-110588]|uniref:acetoacetate decarboxylase family protein n=1 Tax=Streptomyces sp. MST-110588 TaxID=2833628 RepID=UPI001F5E191B|nr:acetoacetate decarboxylase family protein [Streptomyces sp. MST-110588]UNO42795.1 acetoacetate decarboxylase family protein [Streptomyces sp. MST-110588]
MARVRYGPRDEAETRAARAAAGPLPEIWSTGVTAIWESDPQVVAAVLPPPLEPPATPLVRAHIGTVELPGAPLGAGSVAVAARHRGRAGWYPLVMPMTHERALTGGREVFGEPKKLGEVVLERDGTAVRAWLARHGVAFVEVSGEVTGPLPPPEPAVKLDFYFKFLPAVDGSGFDGDPLLVYCTRRERVRRLEAVTGELVLRESPFDPVADLPVRRLVEITVAEKTTDQKGEVIERVSGAALLPYIHQRYDDAGQILDGPPPPPPPPAAPATASGATTSGAAASRPAPARRGGSA